jgi:DNA-binding NarL/FixJ family response regulator
VHTVLIATALGDFAFAGRVLGAFSADRERVLRSMNPASASEVDRARALVEGRLGAVHAAGILAAGAMLSLADASAEAVRWLRAHASGPSESSTSPAPETALTAREREVLAVLAEGHPNKMIAQRLGVSTKTVMHHSVAIYRKLGVRGRAEATAYAHRHGLLGLDAS